MSYVNHLCTAITVVVLLLLFVPPAAADAPPGYLDAATFGYDPTDATAALQAAIDTGSNVFVPNMGSDWIIRPIRLTRSNQAILFESGVVIAAKQGEFMGPTDSLFLASGISNVTMTGYGATLRMRKNDYQQAPYPAAEWRSGIALHSVSGFDIRGLRIEDTGGDAIYIATSSTSTPYSQNVAIKDVVLSNNHRQGISVVSVENLLIDNAVVLNTKGTYPASGIDFEPDYPTHRIVNATVRNSIFQANDGWGILFATTNTEQPYLITIDNVTIVGNHRDGIKMTEPLPGITIKDSLIVDNDGYGFSVHGDSGVPNKILSSALWDNDQGVLFGRAALGDGSAANVKPTFVSMDPNNPHFLYLDPNAPLAIKQGAEDGQHMGARPVFVVPEPNGCTLFGSTILLMSAYRHLTNRSESRLPNEKSR